MAARAPRLFEWGVGALATLGYLYLAVATVGLLGALVFLVVGAIELRAGVLALWTVPLIYSLAAVGRSLRFRVYRPEGIEVPLSSTPRLAALLQEITTRSQGPRIDRVVLRIDLNASLSQYPRAGIFGWYESTLAIGMPLLRAMPPDELTAVLAHEVAHLNGGHGRMGVWIARQLTTYSHLAHELRTRPRPRLERWVLIPLVRWYLPVLQAIHFALARQHEYEADRFAAEFTEPVVAQRALARLEILHRWQQTVRDASLAELANAGRPVPTDLFDGYPARLAADISPERGAEWLAEALKVPTDFHDTHPAVRDRLAALGRDPSSPLSVTWDPREMTALSLLAPNAEAFLARANVAWAAAATPGWHEQQRRSELLSARLQAIPADPVEGSEGIGVEWQRAQVVEQQQGPAAVLPMARRIVARAPEHIPARFMVVRGMLAEGDEGGLLELERLVAREPDLVRAASGLAFPFLWQRGRRAEAERWRERSADREALREKAIAERARYTRRMPLGPHRLGPELVAGLQDALQGIAGADEIYLARRLVKYAPEIPCYIVGVVPTLPWHRATSIRKLRALNETVLRAAAWPHETRVIALAIELKGLRATMRKLEGSLLYQRRKR